MTSTRKQYAIYLKPEIARWHRLQAIRTGAFLPHYLRALFQLPIKVDHDQPRLTMTLSEDERRSLAERFDFDPNDDQQVRQALRAALVNRYNCADSQASPGI
ncbi:MAG: hypothetical protein C9356_15115 [Oleiphilus sp.]|nr:MAG: hypothetical protein C9356_15115 [Oleiphilus sp.]